MTEYNPCECSGAGFCPRYNKDMSQDLYHLCKTREDYRKSFESILSDLEKAEIKRVNEEREDIKKKAEELELGDSPMLNEKEKSDHELADVIIDELDKIGINEGNIQEQSEGLGDTLEKVLTKIGISKERFEKLPGMGGCGCDARKKFLNKIFPYRKKE